MMKELYRIPIWEVECCADNQSLKDYIENLPMIHNGHLRVDIAQIKVLVKLKEIWFKCVPKELKLSNPLKEATTSSK